MKKDRPLPTQAIFGDNGPDAAQLIRESFLLFLKRELEWEASDKTAGTERGCRKTK